MDKEFLKAPFPYFGRKSSVAHIVWEALGDVKHYIEPFFGSGAVLFARPNYKPGEHIETIVDIDGFVCNAWRAIQKAPDEVAKYCDFPVSHIDLHARKHYLDKEKEKLFQKLLDDAEFYDAKIAGYWIYILSTWIGSIKFGIREGQDNKLGQVPYLSSGGVGIHKSNIKNQLGRIPIIGSGSAGIHKLSIQQQSDIENKLGVIPRIADGGVGIHKLSVQKNIIESNLGEPYNHNIYKWFRTLSERLRYVRIVSGDWTRVCGGNWQDQKGIVGIFFDPPYGVEDRDNVYSEDCYNVAHAVREWCKERGKRETYRIVLAGYEEHEELLDYGWTKLQWTANGGYGNQRKVGKNKNNKRETLYFSPYCLKGGKNGKLF